MKKVDLHIHTVKTVSDSEFTFSLDIFKRYVTDAELDAVAVTNHNVFDSTQFKQLQEGLPVKVFPGIEIDLPSGHLLLIADGEDIPAFDSKCARVSSLISNETESITTSQLRSIFGDLSSYLLIPHYEKSPAIRGSDLADLLPYITAGEVDSAKKFVRTMRDREKLCPVLFSDSRMREGLEAMPIRQTFINCGEISLSSIKACLTDKSKVVLSRGDGNALFQVFDDGQYISTGLNVVLGERSSGKTFTLNRLYGAFDGVKYIRQFDLVQASDEEDEKQFNSEVQRRRSRFVDDYLSGFRSVVDKVSKIDVELDDRNVEKYITTLLKAAEEADRRDAYSKVFLYDELEFSISSNDGLKELIASVIHLIENTEYRTVIEAHVQIASLKSLAVDLIKRLWKKLDQDRNRKSVNSIIKDVKDRLRLHTSATHVDTVDLYEAAMNRRRVARFNEIAKALKSESVIFDETVQGFRIVAEKGPFLQASEMSSAIKRQAAFRKALSCYDDPYAFLQVLKTHDKLEEADIHRLFVKITYRILNKEGAEVSGGERSEFRLLQAIKDAQAYGMLLLDEPESSFDNRFLNSDVNQLIKNISKEMPVVVVTHNNNVGASISPDYVIYAQKSIEDGESKHRLYSGHPTDKQLICVDGTTVNNYKIFLDSLEAGPNAYDQRKDIYEAIKD